MSNEAEEHGQRTPFHDLAEFAALPRMSGLVLSPDGTRLVVSVSRPDPKSQRYRSALYAVDPAGERPATRLTRGSSGEGGAVFTSAGDLLFTAKRPDPDGTDSDDRSAVYLLPAGAGEARMLAARTGGFLGVMAARDAATVAFRAGVLPGATDSGSDDDLRKARKEAAVSAILHDGYPVRFWDHDLGPDVPHLLVGDLSAGNERLETRDVTPSPGGALIEQSADLSADGQWLATGWHRPLGRADQRSEIAVVEIETGRRSIVRSDPDADLSGPRFSPDGTRIAYLRERRSTPTTAPAVTVEVVNLADGEVVGPAADWDRWPSSITWLPDSSALVVAADQDGRAPLFLLPVQGGPVRQLTDDDFAYSDAVVSPDGQFVYALRTSYLAPLHPVRVRLDAAVAPVALPAPAELPVLPGTLVDVRSTAADGTPVRGWLALPHGAGPDAPAPLLLWIHGGPLGSWNTWSWRWTPWLMVAAGYAVLLPDPALSTGYGQEFVQRGWGSWGGAPYTDLMSITDQVVQRDDIDHTRTAAMGGSFGGYMANWVAGHTDRFRAIVTHASLWSLEEFGPSTDGANYWGREMSAEMTAKNSPHAFVEKITTPMLVVHGDKDYRVPIGQGIRLWYDLLSKSGRPADEDGRTPHRFLYFPSENHWVLTPGHAILWYEVVLGFLAEHVLDQPAATLPSLLGGPSDPAGSDARG